MGYLLCVRLSVPTLISHTTSCVVGRSLCWSVAVLVGCCGLVFGHCGEVAEVWYYGLVAVVWLLWLGCCGLVAVV